MNQRKVPACATKAQSSPWPYRYLRFAVDCPRDMLGTHLPDHVRFLEMYNDAPRWTLLDWRRKGAESLLDRLTTFYPHATFGRCPACGATLAVREQDHIA